jgi:hypothetical protein
VASEGHEGARTRARVDAQPLDLDHGIQQRAVTRHGEGPTRGAGHVRHGLEPAIGEELAGSAPDRRGGETDAAEHERIGVGAVEREREALIAEHEAAAGRAGGSAVAAAGCDHGRRESLAPRHETLRAQVAVVGREVAVGPDQQSLIVGPQGSGALADEARFMVE